MTIYEIRRSSLDTVFGKGEILATTTNYALLTHVITDAPNLIGAIVYKYESCKDCPVIGFPGFCETCTSEIAAIQPAPHDGSHSDCQW